MADYVSTPTRSAKGQVIEYREFLREGDSPAERRVHVTVSGRTVARGWASDGVTYAEFERIVREGWTES